jgi:hypothetical protein
LKEKLEPENDDNISKYTDALSNGLNSGFLDEMQFKDELEQLQGARSSDYINTKPFQGYQKRGRNINKYYDNVIPGVENKQLGRDGIALNVGNLIDADFTGAGNEGGHGKNKNYRVMNLNTGKVTTFKGDKNIGFDAVPQDLDKDREGIQYNAPFTGKVVLSGMNQHSPGHGLVTIIKNDDPITVDGKVFDTYIVVSHNSENLLNVGDYVDKDTAVATMGGSTFIKGGTKNNPSYEFIRDKRQDVRGYDPHLDLSAFIVPKGENWDVKAKLYVNPKQLEEMYHKQEKKKNSKAMELISELTKKGTLKTPLTMPSMSLTSQDLSNMLRSYDKVKKPTPKKRKK